MLSTLVSEVLYRKLMRIMRTDALLNIGSRDLCLDEKLRVYKSGLQSQQ